MTVRVYRSTDASAPVLTGQVGSLIALLDAVLVNGYGALSAAGWTKSFSTTNKAAYRQNATGANNTAAPMYLYVDDTGPGAGAAREARACGFETMSAITPTGTGQFPTAALSTIGVGTVVIRKSVSADAVARPWTIVANGQTIYLFMRDRRHRLTSRVEHRLHVWRHQVEQIGRSLLGDDHGPGVRELRQFAVRAVELHRSFRIAHLQHEQRHLRAFYCAPLDPDRQRYEVRKDLGPVARRDVERQRSG
jgi:hypothetical protein